MVGPRGAALLLLAAVVLAGCSDGGDGGATSSSSSSSSSVSVSVSAGASGTATNTSSSSTSTSTGPAPLSGTVERDVTDNAFPDGTFTIAKGTTVTWTHRGSNPHSVTADDGSFDSCAAPRPNGCMTSLPGTNTYSHTFEAAGSFPYHCKVHPSMTGTITVV